MTTLADEYAETTPVPLNSTVTYHGSLEEFHDTAYTVIDKRRVYGTGMALTLEPIGPKAYRLPNIYTVRPKNVTVIVLPDNFDPEESK